MKNKKRFIYFCIGTEAELIKLFTVIIEIKNKNIPYRIISSGQNNISDSPLLRICNNGKIDFLLSDYPIKKNVFGLLSWFIKTYIAGLKILDGKLAAGSVLLVHGDTISTVMGALLGKKFGLRVAHIEAGLRSKNYLNPFPEEIDRVITSHIATLHFAPNEWSLNNLKKVTGKKVNTEANTLLDALRYVKSIKLKDKLPVDLGDRYFVFVLHRQENLLNEGLVRAIIKRVEIVSRSTKCVFILHEPTKAVLDKLNILKQLKINKNIILTNRVNYINFMELLDNSEFVITDGGSNQEELYYMGKPCLLLRTRTERIEGLDENVVLSKNNLDVFDSFINNYEEYKMTTNLEKLWPSKIIANALEKEL